MKLTFKIWLLIIILAFSIVSVVGFPPVFLEHGLMIKSVDANSTAFQQGFNDGQIITAIDGQKIDSVLDYSSILVNKFLSNQDVKTIFSIKNREDIIFFDNAAPSITVAEISSTRVQTGLDLSGGSRALIQAEDIKLTSAQANDLVDVISNRFNVYGIADIKVRPISDLSGDNFVLIEVAGATPKDLENLISQQGDFKAKIGNQTVFSGGDKDISSVCRNDATCAGIESCQPSSSGDYFCNFRFSVYLSEAAARRHADITKNIPINSSPTGSYLAQPLDLYIDGQLVDSLLISESLRGQITTQISISGSGTGPSQEDALGNAQDNMNKLQTVLITGSLPFKLEIVKLDTISPTLGKTFINSIFLAGLVALIAVSLIVFFRYKKLKYVLALMLTSLSEIVIILGIAAFIGWNLDLPSIAGILATIGTGIDSQIIVLDEANQEKSLSIKEKIKRAFRIILGAYFTSLVALLPLLSAGAGLLKGFAITTIIGISVGVLITRPAFTDIIRKIEE